MTDPSVRSPDAGDPPSDGPLSADDPSPAAPVSLSELAERAAEEMRGLGAELAEIEMLVTQARTEAGRHETRRAQAAEKLAAAVARDEPAEITEVQGQLVTLTKRAAVMAAQVDVLEGKARALARYRDGLAVYAGALALLAGGHEGEGADEAAAGSGGVSDAAAMSRVVLAAQEDLRREIARAMHDGPAQSLTNIVLQAEIVDLLLQKDVEQARSELRLLVAMVQQTLEATKSFIFDVRPMVLDDLGLVPTLRRAVRERSRRTQVPITFESDGQDRRLPPDLESGVFRIVDESLAAYLERHPDRMLVTMAWDQELVIEVVAQRDAPTPPPEDEVVPAPAADVPPALAAMIEDRREEARPVAPPPVELPASTWRELEGRVAAMGAAVELLDDGSRLRLVVPLPETG